MKKGGHLVVGVIFVLIGAGFLLNNLHVAGDFFNPIRVLVRCWPIFFLVLPGLAFHSVYFSGKSQSAGVLVPGGIFLVSGVIYQLAYLFGKVSLFFLPVLLLAVAAGLFELYLFGGRQKSLLIPVTVLTVLSLFLFSSYTFKNLFGVGLGSVIVPLALILAGAGVLLRGRKLW